MSSLDSSISIRTAFLSDIPSIQKVVDPAWWATYSPILTDQQVDFMLKLFYNEEALTKLISSGEQEFVLILKNNNTVGFAAFAQRPESSGTFKLNKLYLLPELKGNGYGRLLMDEVERRVRLQQGSILELNVNKYNESQHFYRKMGFEIAYEEDIPVGEYWMNDFVMRKRVAR